MKNRIRNFRLRLAARIAGGEVVTYGGCMANGRWRKGEVIVTPAGRDAIKAAFRAGAAVDDHTSITPWNPLP